MAAKKRRSLFVLLLTLVAAAVVTGRLFASGDAVGLVVVLAPLFLLGSVLSGGMPAAHRKKGRRPVVGPVLTGLLVFLWFLVAGAAVRWAIPAFDHGVVEVLAKADRGSTVAVALSAVLAGFAEEVFYRGALFERLPMPVVTTTFAHALAVLPSGNVAMVGAAVALGGVCGLSRRASGGWWTAAVVHSTWSLLVLVWLPR